MLKLELYRRSKDLFSLPLIREGALIIVPDPQMADEIREIFQKHFHIWEVEIQTMNNFLRERLALAFGRDFVGQLKSKEELTLFFGTVWKKLFPEKSYENFLRAFHIFSELRSYSLHHPLTQDFLQDFDEVLSSAVFHFWELARRLDLVDESRAFQLLTDFHLSGSAASGSGGGSGGETWRKNSYVFWGFTYFSGVQIDYLKALSAHQDIYIPFPQRVFEKIHADDWVSWLTTEALPPPLEEESPKTLCRVVYFPKNHLAKALKEFALSYPSPKPLAVYLGTRSSQYAHLAEIPFASSYFKCANSFFQETAKKISQEILDEFFKTFADKIPWENLEKILREKIVQNLAEKNFRGLKVLTIWIEEIQRYKELSDENLSLGFFDLKVLAQVVFLKLPRIYNIPLNSEEKGEALGAVSDLDHLLIPSPDQLSLFCVSSGHGPLNMIDHSPMETLYSQLRSVGPVKRGELAYQLLAEKIREFLEEENTLVFMEKGILETSLAWKEIFAPFHLQAVPVPLKALVPYPGQYGLQPLKKRQAEVSNLLEFTPSKLQHYIDCPRKYFLENLTHFSPKIKLDNSLLGRDLGKIEHDLIAKYLELFNVWSEDGHRELAQGLLQKYLEREEIVLEEFDRLHYLKEIVTYTQNAIHFLLRLKAVGGDPLRLTFEKKIESFEERIIKRKGRVDCLIEGAWGYGVLDFKRSGAGIPTMKELERFEDIQLWFYLQHLPVEKDKIAFWGFVNLQDPRDSYFVAKEKTMYELLSKIVGKELGKVSLYKEDFPQKLGEYRLFEEDLINKIAVREEFPVKPRSKEVCLHCFIKNICPRVSQAAVL